MTRWGLTGVLGLAILSAGCQDAGLETLERRLMAWRADAVAPSVKGMPALPAPMLVSYRFADSPDPFSLDEPKEGRAGAGEMTSQHVPRGVLEGHAIETLSLVGTLSVAGESWALVKTPEGRVHRVGIDDRLGRHRGRIVAIAEAAVHLVERRPDGHGGWNERDVILRLDD